MWFLATLSMWKAVPSNVILVLGNAVYEDLEVVGCALDGVDRSAHVGSLEEIEGVDSITLTSDATTVDGDTVPFKEGGVPGYATDGGRLCPYIVSISGETDDEKPSLSSVRYSDPSSFDVDGTSIDMDGALIGEASLMLPLLLEEEMFDLVASITTRAMMAAVRGVRVNNMQRLRPRSSVRWLRRLDLGMMFGPTRWAEGGSRVVQSGPGMLGTSVWSKEWQGVISDNEK